MYIHTCTSVCTCTGVHNFPHEMHGRWVVGGGGGGRVNKSVIHLTCRCIYPDPIILHMLRFYTYSKIINYQSQIILFYDLEASFHYQSK